jgi:hypothetical protein
MSPKWLLLFRAPDGARREQYCRSFLEWQECGPAVCNIADVQPAFIGRPRGVPSLPNYDVIVELWSDLPALRRRSGLVCVCEVDESVEKFIPSLSGGPPRVKLFSFIEPLAGLTTSDFRRHWDEHVPIARRVHRVCVQYVRHFVTATYPAPQVFTGIGMIAFATLKDLEERSFDTPDGEAEVMADTAEFVGTRNVVYTTEHVLAR